MSLSKKVLFCMIAVGVAITLIVIVFSVVYPSAFLGNDGPREENEGNGGDDIEGVTGNDDSPQEQCAPARSDAPDTSVNDSELNEELGLIGIGNPVGAEHQAGITALVLKAPAEKASFRFTAKYSGEIRSIAINLLHSLGNQSDFQVGLQEDDGKGKPGGNWMHKPVGGNTRTDRYGFVTIDLEDSVQLSKDQVYHLVIETTDPAVPNSNELQIRVYNIYVPFQPLNDDNPDILWPDAAMDALYYDGTVWQESENWPVFALNYSDGRSLGQPYSLAAPWYIYGKRHVGQEIIPSSNYVIGQIGFSVAARGKPADALCYEVRDSDNKVLANGLFVDRGELSISTRFVKVNLVSPLTLEKDKVYRFVLFSPMTELAEPYNVYGHEFTYNTNIGYGGLRNILTVSYDSGSTWQRWEDADTIFILGTQ